MDKKEDMVKPIKYVDIFDYIKASNCTIKNKNSQETAAYIHISLNGFMVFFRGEINHSN